jgi:hypothetical protein
MWSVLPEEEKAAYFTSAKEADREHQRKYPSKYISPYL